MSVGRHAAVMLQPGVGGGIFLHIFDDPRVQKKSKTANLNVTKLDKNLKWD